MLDAGVSIGEATGVLARQTHPRTLSACLHSVSESIMQGRSLSDALARCPRYFSRFHVAAVAAGEASGTLVNALRSLAEYLEGEHRLRNEIKRELFYPNLVMALVLLLWPIVLGRLGDKPVLLVLVGVVPLATFGLLLLLGTLLTNLSGRRRPFLDGFVLKVPVIGRTAHLISQTNFVRNLTFLYSAGLSLPEAVRWSADACGNVCVADRLRPAATRLQQGVGLAAALRATQTLDPMVLTLAATGETTGDLKAVLPRAIEQLRLVTDMSLHALKLSLGIAALLNAGFCVGAIMLASYT